MSRSASRPRQPLALVVDDHPDGREIACRVLGGLGLGTIEASDGLDALELARRERPDLVLLDLALPGLDGWSVARQLREDPQTSGLLVLGFTAHAEEGPLERALAAGCDAVLAKPCSPRDLADHVRTLLDRRRPEPERRTLSG